MCAREMGYVICASHRMRICAVPFVVAKLTFPRFSAPPSRVDATSHRRSLCQNAHHLPRLQLATPVSKVLLVLKSSLLIPVT